MAASFDAAAAVAASNLHADPFPQPVPAVAGASSVAAPVAPWAPPAGAAVPAFNPASAPAFVPAFTPGPAAVAAAARPAAVATAAHVPAPTTFTPAAASNLAAAPTFVSAATTAAPAPAKPVSGTEPASMSLSAFLSHPSASPLAAIGAPFGGGAAPAHELPPSASAAAAAAAAAAGDYDADDGNSNLMTAADRERLRVEREAWEANERKAMAARKELAAASGGGGGGGARRGAPKDFAFAHNNRLLWVLVPGLLVVLALGGTPLAGTLVVGLLVTYMCDALKMRTASAVSLWLTLIVGIIVLNLYGLYRRVPQGRAGAGVSWYSMFMLLNCNTFLALVGLWATIQLPFIAMDVPEAGDVAERVLFGAIGMPASALIMWAIMSLNGTNNAPYYYIALTFAVYRLTQSPLTPSSLVDAALTSAGKKSDAGGKAGHAPSVGASGAYINGSRVTGLNTVMFLLSPAAFYMAIYKVSIFTLWGAANVTLLIALPALLLTTLVSSDTLWWLGVPRDAASASPSASASSSSLAAVQFTLSAVVALCLEYRVVLHAFSGYLVLHATNPFVSWLLLTVCVFSALVAFWLVVWGLNARSRKSKRALLFQACVFVCALTGALSLGASWYLLPFVVAGAYAATYFYFHRSFVVYVAFVAACAVAAFVFMSKTYWFLQVQMTAALSLQSVSLLIVLLLVLALMIPGLTILSVSPRLTGILLSVHAFGLACVEYVLFSQNPKYDSAVYPAYVVVATTAVGLWMASRMADEKQVSATAHAVLASLYVGKCGLLLCAPGATAAAAELDVGFRALLWILAAAASVVPPMVLPAGVTADSNTNVVVKVAPMSVQRGIVHATLIAATLFLARHTLVTAVLELIGHRVPSESQVLAAWALLTCAAWLPLSFRHFAHMPAVRRGNSIVMALSVLFVVIQPRVDIFSSNSGAAAGDVLMESTGARWPAWLLFIALALLLVSLTSILPLPRLVFALTLGSCLGLYLCGLYIPAGPGAWVLSALVLATFNCVALLLVYLHWPTTASPAIMSAAYAVAVTTLPVAMYWAGEVYAYTPRRRGTDALVLTRVTLLGTHAALHVLVALGVKLNRQSPLRRLALATAGGAAAAAGTDAEPAKGKTLYQASGHGFHRKVGSEAAVGGVDALIGNVSCFLALGVGLWLNLHYLRGSELSVFFLSPILLLLNADTGVFRSLTDERRYFPIVAAIVAFLLSSAAFHVFLRPLMAWAGIAVFGTGPVFSWWFLIKNYLTTLCALPSVFKFLGFLWALHTEAVFGLLCVAPLNFLALFLSDLVAAKVLGVIGLIGCVVQMVMMEQIRRHGLRII